MGSLLVDDAGAGYLFSSEDRQLMGHGSRPAAVAQRMHLHPDPVLPCIQLQRARTAWNPEMPMTAAGPPGQFTFASNHNAAPAALLENLLGRDIEIEYEQSRPSRESTCAPCPCELRPPAILD